MKTTLRVLMVEDDTADADLIARALRAAGNTLETTRVDTGPAMRGALERGTWDLVLSDWSMPQFSAPVALALLKEMRVDVPFIIVSGTISEQVAVEAMRAGAHDYVLKDRLGRLAPAVDRELREAADRREHRRADAALRESEARFRRLAESGLVGITIADKGGRIHDSNDKFLQMVGYTRDDLLAGRVNWQALTPPELLTASLATTARLKDDGVAAPWEKQYVRKDGSRVPVLVGVATLDEDRNIGIAVDLTNQAKAEEGRRRAEEALRRSEEQLRQAQKMEAVGRLAGGVAHDFNNVLSVIMSYGEFLLDALDPADPMRADVIEIRAAAARAAGLTRQLLLFSRQQPAEARVLDLNELLAGMHKMVARILGEDVQLTTVGHGEPGRVRVDPTHIEQVVLNLVVNARDAMPKGGKVTIETSSVMLDEEYAAAHVPAKAGPYVMLTVTDTGSGMDKETQTRMFEPFFTTKETGKGTGLGLSTVFGIVQQSGGHIWVYSELGVGTCFKIYLPRVSAEVHPVRSQLPPSTLRGSETVLLVEDEEQVRTVLVTALRKQGYEVLVAQHAGDALLLSEQHAGRIDLLVTDVVMPQMSGPELATRLAPHRPDMRVLCISGYTDDSIVRHGVLDGAMAFLQKPITPATLATKVRAVLDGEKAAASTFPTR